jgi:hypothetical protein
LLPEKETKPFFVFCVFFFPFLKPFRIIIGRNGDKPLQRNAVAAISTTKTVGQAEMVTRTQASGLSKQEFVEALC